MQDNTNTFVYTSFSAAFFLSRLPQTDLNQFSIVLPFYSYLSEKAKKRKKYARIYWIQIKQTNANKCEQLFFTDVASTVSFIWTVLCDEKIFSPLLAQLSGLFNVAN